MRIEPNSQMDTAWYSKTAGSQKARPASEDAASTSVTPLTSALEKTTDLRADKVARAKALVADSSYPSDEDLDKVAGVLANHLSSSQADTSVSP